MATDGVKIIDGDLAHDIYWGFMDMYDNDASIDDINQRYPFDRKDYYNDFDYEIYVTALALAYWEIGAITKEALMTVETVIGKAAGEKSWSESHGEKAGRLRKKELEKLWQKINNENPKPRKRKKYKKITESIFKENDVLVFQNNDGHYFVTILLTIHQYRGACDYRFAKIFYSQPDKPALESVLQLPIAGNNIPSLIDPMPLLQQGLEKIMEQGGLDVVLKKEALRLGQYTTGLCQTGISHEHLLGFSNKFELIGQIKIQQPFKYIATLDIASSFDDFCGRLIDLEYQIKTINGDWFAVSQLVDAGTVE